MTMCGGGSAIETPSGPLSLHEDIGVGAMARDEQDIGEGLAQYCKHSRNGLLSGQCG